MQLIVTAGLGRGGVTRKVCDAGTRGWTDLDCWQAVLSGMTARSGMTSVWPDIHLA